MENDKIKTTRASQSRAKDKRPTTWTPPSSLDAPPAPDGYRHRWIRTEVLGFDDTKNMSGKMRSDVCGEFRIICSRPSSVG